MNRTTNQHLRVLSGLAFGLLASILSACELQVGDAAPQPSVDTAAPATTATSPTTTSNASDQPPPTTGVDGIDAVSASTVQIVARGTFLDPEFGAYEAAGSGSGFVIDPSGIAVTNNHVVGGAGLLEVYVPGENRPRNARVLGVSECSDLAVIDIEGAALPALQWYTGPVAPGLEIYAAGFPLGDPEYTLTRGIISKAEARGETPWASVDHVVEHDASIQPGNSGGPLVTSTGRVVGINYAGGSPTNTEQFFAIEAADARSIIDRLRRGEDVDSLGINGRAVQSDDGSLAGIWVSGVTSGSPADLAGVEPGDVLTRLEGVSLGTDGTFADYCDVMRTHAPGDVGGRGPQVCDERDAHGPVQREPLTPAFSFADEYDGSTGDGEAYSDYVTISDDSGSLTVSVPAEWSETDGADRSRRSLLTVHPGLRRSRDVRGQLGRTRNAVRRQRGAGCVQQR
ncbi:MAG: S1C family serine protease [Ilumatobacteraceae bacterium]